MKCCDMSAGKLRHSITIERKQRVDDGLGGSSLQWSQIKSTRAFIKPLSGNESLQAQRIESKTTHRIYLRYFAGLKAADKVVYQGRDFNIKVPINIEERNKWYELHCEEGTAQ